MITKEFFIDIYDTNITLVLSDTAKKTSENIKKIYKLEKIKREKDDVPKACAGYVLEPKGRKYYIFLCEEYADENTISHECYHLTEFIGDYNGLSTTDAKEDRAYLNGYLNIKIRRLLKEMNVTIK